MRTITLIISSLMLLSVASIVTTAAAEKRQTIRFYKLNSKDQAVRVKVRESTAKQAGCHNFIVKKRIFRLTQIGFEYCTVYTDKNCAVSSEINGVWEESDVSTQLTQGGEWLFTQDNPKGVKMKSWSCH